MCRWLDLYAPFVQFANLKILIPRIVILVLKPKGIIMVLFHDLEHLLIGIETIAHPDIAQVVGIVIDIIEMVPVILGIPHITLGCREKLQYPVIILESVHVKGP